MGENKGKKIIVFVGCIALNLLGKYAALVLRLPLWLDMTGTCVASYFLGLPAALVVALLNNLVFGFLNGTSYIYALTSLACALFFRFFARKGYMDKFPTAILSGFWMGAVSIFVSTPLNLITNNGYSGNRWGDAFFDMLMWYGFGRKAAAICGELIVDIVDKQICLVLGYFLIRWIRNRFGLQSFSDSADGNSGHKTRRKKERVKKAAACLIAAALVTSIAPTGMVSAAETETVNYSSTIYNNLNGLMSSEANAIAQTDDGYMWIGSYAGLTRYDGTAFEFIRGEHIASVRDLFCDSKGRLWIGTNDGGVFRYEDGAYRQFTMQDGLPSDSIRCFYETGDGTVYVATTDELCTFGEDDTITTLDAELTCVVSMTSYDGKLICVAKDGKVYALEDGTVVAESDEDTDTTAFTGVQNTSKGLLAGTTGKNLFVLGISGKHIRVSKEITVPVQNIKQIIENASGQIWLCGGDGLGYLDSSDAYHAMSVDGFDASMEDVTQDYQGNIWVASSSYGVMKLTPNLFGNIFTESGVSAEVCNAVVSYNGDQYCGTDSGLIIIDEKNHKQITNDLTDVIGEDRVRAMLADDAGRLWLCTYGENGLICLNRDGSMRMYTEESDALVTTNRIRCIIQTGEDTFAVGTADGIFFVEDGQVTAHITKEDGLENSQILAFACGADGYLYAGSDGGGIYRIREQKIVDSLTTADGLSSDVIMRFVAYEDDMLVVTSNSLCLLSGIGEEQDGQISVLTEFPYFNNYDILIYGDAAYVLSSAGIYAVDIEQLVQGRELAYALYSAKSGLLSGITANSWNYMSEDGVLYFCCSDGVMTFDTANDLTDDEFRYGIREMLCDGEPADVSGSRLEIPQDTEQVTLTASVRNYSLTDVKVKFFLQGEEDTAELTAASEISDIRIDKPTAGEYTVHFQIYNLSGTKLLDEKTYTLVKTSQMWEKPWYKLYLFLVGAESAVILIWSIVCVMENRRKSLELENFAKQLEEKVEEQKQKLAEESKDKDRMLMNTVIALSSTVDAKDRYTSGHSSRVAKYARMLAARMGKSEAEQDAIYCAGLLHDVGKIRVPEVIINKPGKLTEDEYEVIKLHPITGYHILKGISPDDIFADGAKFHHERYDGKGYPNGLVGKAIPEIARIICVADAYDAMASNRSYRSAMPQSYVRGEIENGRGTQFDPEIADIMLRLIDEDSDYHMREGDHRRTKVLAVDDSPQVLDDVESALLDEGIYITRGVTELATAKEILEKETYDVLLLDVTVLGEDIYETVKKLRKYSEAPIIFMTEDRVPIEMEKGRRIGVDDFITKPFMATALKEIVHAVVSQRSGE